MKWNMGWMNDTLSFFKQDPIHRRYHQGRLTFGIMYAFSENFMLALSHDEVVHGKGSLVNKMPGDDWQKLANLRLLWGYMYTQPGKKLNFMGGEIGQWSEWNHDASVDWPLLEQQRHQGMLRWVRDLNTLYRGAPALYERDFSEEGFQWVDCNDAEKSVLTYLRKGKNPADTLLIAANFTPIPRHNYRVGVPEAGRWNEVLNSDAPIYGGSGQGNMGGVEATPVRFFDKFDQSLSLTLPPLSVVVFQHESNAQPN